MEMVLPGEIILPKTAAISCTEEKLDKNFLFNCQKINVNTYCLYKIIHDLSIPKISFIKCDVEGHELQIIKGAKKTLIEHKPLISIEILEEKWKNDNPLQSDFAQFIINLDYKMGEQLRGKIVYPSKFITKNKNFVFYPTV